MHDKYWARIKRGAARILPYEIWLTGAGVLLASAAVRTAPWGLGILGVLWLTRWIAEGRWCEPTPIDWPVGLLLGMSGIAWLVTPDRESTFLALSRLCGGLSLTYCIVHWSKEPTRLVILLRGGILGSLVLGLATPLLIPLRGTTGEFYALLPHLEENALNPNMVAGVLVMLLPFSLAGSILQMNLPRAVTSSPAAARSKTWFWISTLALLLCGGALILTRSRGGWLAAAAAVLIIAIGRTPLSAWVLLLLPLAAGWMIRQGRVTVFLDVLGSGGEVTGWAERVDIWRRTGYLIQEFPFTGIGANTFAQTINLLHPSFFISQLQSIPHAHNLYLQIAVDLGLPGLVAFISIMLLALTGVVQSLRHVPHHSVQSVVTWACCASLAAMLVHGLVDVTTWIVGWGAPLPWMVLGLLLAAARLSTGFVPAQNSEQLCSASNSLPNH